MKFPFYPGSAMRAEISARIVRIDRVLARLAIEDLESVCHIDFP
jgi:hypothetical protein